MGNQAQRPEALFLNVLPYRYQQLGIGQLKKKYLTVFYLRFFNASYLQRFLNLLYHNFFSSSIKTSSIKTITFNNIVSQFKSMDEVFMISYKNSNCLTLKCQLFTSFRSFISNKKENGLRCLIKYLHMYDNAF